jgi:DNA primase
VSLLHVISRKSTLESEVTRCEANLDVAARYLATRGITKEAAVKHRLGVFSDPTPEFEQFKGKLCIPYLTATGPLTVKARCMQDHNCKEHGHPKYMCETDIPPLLYNAPDLLVDADVLYVCEGELDAVVVSGVLGLPCVAFPGAANWRPHFNKAVSPDWEQIYVIADGDDPGRAAARDVAKHLRARVIKMPDGDDVSSFYMKNGREATLAKLQAA